MSEEIIGCEPIDIKDYKIDFLLDRNSFSYAYKAIDKNTNKEFSLRFFPTDIEINSHKNVIRWINISNSGVPGLVKTLGYQFQAHDSAGKICDAIITNFYRPQNLNEITKEYLESKGRNSTTMNPTVRSKIIFGISSIMKQLHSKNIILRDLKLSNIYLNDQLEPEIYNLYLSRYVTNPLEMTFGVGTPIFMAPEVIEQDEPYSFPVDVYSFAIIIYSMFESKYEFSDRRQIRGTFDLFRRIVNGERFARPEGIPDHYWNLIERCWKRDPSQRPTFAEITEELREDKFAIEEFGHQTNLDELHEYQQRIDSD